MDGLYRRKCWVKVLRTVTYAALVAAAPEDVVDMFVKTHVNKEE